MCGITGILFKDPERVGPVGRIQVEMLQALHRRGPDSAGVALYGPPHAGYLLRARLQPDGDGRVERAREAIEALATVRELAPTPGGVSASLGYEGELAALADGVEAADE